MSDLVHRARAFAVAAHGDQRYGSAPYSVHLDAVADLLTPFGDTARAVGFLHDVVEDTPTPLEDIRAAFGDLIADCVALVTDPPGTNRADRKASANAKLAGVPPGPRELALIVKAADRLANLRASVRDGRESKLAMYRHEHADFRRAAYRPGLCDNLWTEMDAIIGPPT